MKKIVFSLFSLFLIIGITSADVVQAQVRPYRVTDTQMQALLTRIEQRTRTFQNEIDVAIRQSRMTNTDDEAMINGYIGELNSSTFNLRQSVNARRSTRAEVTDLLNSATFINQFMQRNRFNLRTQQAWTALRTDLNTLATNYRVSWNWNTVPQTTGVSTGTVGTGGLPYRVTDNNVRTILDRIASRTNTFRREVDTTINQGTLGRTRSRDFFFTNISEFESAVNDLRRNFDSRRSTTTNVEEVLSRGYNIDSFLRDFRFSTTAETQWRQIRTDLDTLAGYYNVSWNWENRQFIPTSRFDTMLTGTYRLNVNQSDDVRDVINQSVSVYTMNQRDRMRENLEARLSSPEMLVIEKRSNMVTVASSNSPQIEFEADGVMRTEVADRGRSIRVTANTTYDGVSINTEGDRINDFYVNFSPMNNGQLRVIRRVYLPGRNETVAVASVYDRVSGRADWAMIQNTQNNENWGGNVSNQFIIPNNTRMTAVLRSTISTRASQSGDRFQMEVTSPSQFNGAMIEGRIANADRSGRVSGRANVSLEFDTIRLRNGQTYRFAGIVDDVTLASGERVTVNNEGTVRDNNQTTKTVQRAGIGAAVGAIIGAIAGGTQGAVIGAGVGAGAGAGSVILQGRDDVEIDPGSQFTITATGPNNTGTIR